MRADQALGLVEPRGWNRRSCGDGSKGRRLYDFQDAKQVAALDEAQVRGYRAWKRHTALALAAYALLAIASALAKATHPAPVLPDEPGQQAPADCGMTALTVPEIQRLLTAASTQPTDIEFHLTWSNWRRRHQA